MRISRELAIIILKYLDRYPKFYFPFKVINKNFEYDLEVEPEEWNIIKTDLIYKDFELHENLNSLYAPTLELMSKWFIQKIAGSDLRKKIKILAKWYKKLYKKEKTDSLKILEYWENEFFWGKAEAFEEVLEMIRKLSI